MKDIRDWTVNDYEVFCNAYVEHGLRLLLLENVLECNVRVLDVGDVSAEVMTDLTHPKCTVYVYRDKQEDFHYLCGVLMHELAHVFSYRYRQFGISHAGESVVEFSLCHEDFAFRFERLMGKLGVIKECVSHAVSALEVSCQGETKNV